MTAPATWTPDQPLIRVRDVHLSFGTVTVLNGISLDVMKGEVICVIGPSGAGKSTLLRCINALVPIDSGSIRVEGQEVNDPKLDKLALRRYIFTLTFVYLISYAGYFLLPALGPRYALAGRHTVPLDTTAIARTISTKLDELEHTKFDVFPSGHTMIAVTVLMVSFRRARRFFWFALPVALCLIASTVYCRYHYAIDVIAGAILTLAAVPLGDAIYDTLTERRVFSP